MKFSFFKSVVLLGAGFCFFIFTYHMHAVRGIHHAVQEHAKIVAESVWDLNLKGSEEYLRAVALHNNYENIVVRDIDGEKLIEVLQPADNWVERELVKLKLIPREKVSAQIVHRGESLGTVEALWLDKSIYAYAYAFLIVLLFFAVILLYKRVLRAKATLEQKVKERTRDLTEKTEALSQSERKIRAIFNQSLQFIGLLDADGTLLEANQTPLLAWGVEKSDVINKPFWEAPWFTGTPGLSTKIRQYLEIAAQGRIVRQEIEQVGPAGATLYVDFSLKPILDSEGRVVLMIPEGRDITVLRSVQEDLRYSEELHRITIESISDPVFITDDAGKFTYIGENVAQVLGYPIQEIQSMANIQLLVGDPLFRLEELKKSGEIHNIETSISGKDGKKHFFLTNIKYVSIKNGTILYTFHEITELKTANDALKKSEKSYRTLAENLPGLVYRLFLTENNRMQFFNNMLEPMTGYQESELSSGTISPIESGIVPEDRNRIAAAIEKAVQEKKTFEMEYGFQHKLGGIRYFHEMGRPVFGEDGNPQYIDGVIFDITANRQALQKQQELEAQLRQAQKLEALGALAGGITHDFNNILTSIYGYSQLALMELPDDSNVKSYIRDMYDAARRARELVKQILTFSRQEAQKQSPVEVRIIVKEALKLLRASIPSTIEIRQNIAAQCGSVMANPTQIHQILMNLCTNAYHAMRETGGVLTVSLAQHNFAAGTVIDGVAFPAGTYLQLEVSDTGHGMDKQVLERIFEPYFTTKPKGEGTGMGLSVVHGIVKSHGGNITVRSEPGKGASFRIYWPVINQSAFPDEPAITEIFPGGSETILLVDDEESTLKAEEAILKKLGYRTHSFSAPVAALDHLREQPDRFDLVITDMTMPVMTGVDFSREVMAVRPDLPIVLCTGYSEIINEAGAKEIGVQAFVMKPLEIREFAALLRKILEKKEKKPHRP